jgi:hypothetical protein
VNDHAPSSPTTNDPVGNHADGMPAAGTQSTTPRGLLIPRGLVMLSAAWIFTSWIALFGLHPPVQPQAASYGPSIHLLFILLGVGIAVAWPLLRLSGRPSAVPVAQAAIDGLSIFVLVQVVVWPLRLVTNWTLPRTLVVDTAIAAAIVTTAAILAASQGCTRPRPRIVAMGVGMCLVLLPWILGLIRLGPPIDAFLGETATALSAPALLGRFSGPATLDPTDADRALALRAVALSAMAWAVVVVMRLTRRSADST